MLIWTGPRGWFRGSGREAQIQGNLNRRTAGACVLALLAGGLAAAGVTAHTTRTDTDITINGFTSGGVSEYFYGDLASPNANCESRRRVRILRKRPGDDKLYEATRSLDPSGTYTVEAETGNIPQGDYYSHVGKRDLKPGDRHRHLCKGAKSNEMAVGP